MHQTNARQGTEADLDLLTRLLNDAPDPADPIRVRQYLHNLADAGLSVLLIKPGTKEPFDGRTAGKRLADDKTAQLAAKKAGQRNWRKVKSPSGVHLASRDAAALGGYLDRYIAAFGPDCAVNIAVALGRSRLVVVDCDTPEQQAEFLAVLPLDDPAPTVVTPGQLGADGETMVHRDGGHFWFVVPDGVDLPECLESATMGTGDGGGYSVLWGPGKYVLIPPSVRPEGAYKAVGKVHPLPATLRDEIATHAAARRQRAGRSEGCADGPIAMWGAAITWAEILAGTDWTLASRTDSCGCEIWTAPGPHADPKSATAHEPGCTQWTDSPDPPLHIWTDHDVDPFAGLGATVTRLQAVTRIDYGGDLTAAMDALDLHDEPVTIDGRTCRDEGRGPANLPEEFWAAHPVLTHIRDAAHRGLNSADAVLGAILARLAAHVDPAVTVDTGIKAPMPLSMFVGLVSSAGGGKSSACAAAERLLELCLPDPLTPNLIAAHETPVERPVGTGPGVAEAFMGTVVDPGDPTGKIKRREQVGHKLLLHSDEGAGLVAGILDTKNANRIGPVLRAAWTGSVLGDGNASADRRRVVRDYVVGLVAGFQLEALAALSTAEQMEYGTPQRFLYLAATDPAIPDDAPVDPGQLEVKLPTRPLRYSDELQQQVRAEVLHRARGLADDEDPMHAHRPAMTARLAALLVVLCDPGRTVIEAGDVQLAEMLLNISVCIHERAMDYRREREAAERERQAEARIQEQVATAAAVDDREARLDRLGERILRRVNEAGGTAMWSGRRGLRQKFKSNERQLADIALSRLVDRGAVTYDGDANKVVRV
ncbi:bifunctional DNA primase/polymerase [Mycobacterium intermedium]|uniref:bifunctional DNA primase/polymerase n=2 Tax=Mycobacterium intermedium TaxID=28445 RepID=UPI000A70F776|nr:bifunctional DNA primase/polymerase [Mycobacterium intermedium]MCV6965985.1 bifunctional DNA primase/polymerase [Mycobacterium intermedium]